jgi:hypothetical protein
LMCRLISSVFVLGTCSWPATALTTQRKIVICLTSASWTDTGP